MRLALKDRLINIIFILFPLSFILGNFAINLNIVLFISFFLFDLARDKNKFYEENKTYFFISLIFIAYLFFNTLISNYFESENIIKAIFYIRFFLLFIAIKYYIEKDVIKLNLTFKYWSILLTIVFVDLLFEIINGKNLLGYSANIPGRLASFFKDELIVGFFLSSFGLILISNLISRNLKYAFLLLLLIFAVLITGERTSFIRLFLTLFFVFIFIDNININKKKLLTISISFFILFVGIINFSNISYFENIKKRYGIRYVEKDNWYSIGGLDFRSKPNICKAESCKGEVFDTTSNFYYKTHYGKYYLISKHILAENLFFGTGNKTFRVACKDYKKVLENIYKLTDPGCTTHPHQIYYELISEHGLIGTFIILILLFYLLFIPMKKMSLRNDIFKLIIFFYLISYFIPIIPSGSFFSTVNSFIYWFFYGFYTSKKSNMTN